MASKELLINVATYFPMHAVAHWGGIIHEMHRKLTVINTLHTCIVTTQLLIICKI